jgi:hypothetical protein
MSGEQAGHGETLREPSPSGAATPRTPPQRTLAESPHPRWISLERLVTTAALVLLAGFYAVFVVRGHWTGRTWWERACYETGQGRNIYTLNYQVWLTRSEPEPWFAYGAGSLYLAMPLYLASWGLTGSATPDLFVRLCVLAAFASHAGLALVGARLVREQGGRPAAAAAVLAALALNPILLRLGAMGDIIDLPMLLLCALYLLSLVRGQFRGAGIWLSLAVVVKQFPVLFFPDLFIRAARARRWGALLWSAVPAALLSLPYLLWSPREYLFFLAGSVTAWRGIYSGAWWNVFAYLNDGLPEGWLRAFSLALLLGALALVYWATWRRKLPAPAAAALVANAFWMLYHSSYDLYVGWGLALATIALGSAGRSADEG